MKGIAKAAFLLLFLGFSNANAALLDSNSFFVSDVIILGNSKTKDYIILRELTFSVGDTLKDWTYHHTQSRKQLLNLFLFNEVEINKVQDVITIRLKERWYYWPKPVLDYADRNLNQWLLQKDLKRLIYGVNFAAYNFRGRNETLKIDLVSGYTKQVGIKYRIPYFNKNKTWGVELESDYRVNKEVWFKTMDDKLQFFKDKDLNLIKNWYSELRFIHRKKFFTYHHFYSGFKYTRVSDTVLTKDVNDLFLFNTENIQKEAYIGYDFINDKRDFKGFPLKGHYLKVSAIASRFFSEYDPLNALSLKLTFSKYIQLSKKWYASGQVNGRYYQNNRTPYSRIQALGYNKDYVRGYELKVIDGQQFALFKSELKYKLFEKSYPLAKSIIGYEDMPVSVFLSAFSDAAFVNTDRVSLERSLNNQLPNNWFIGYGAGLNLVVFYDYLMRVEYSFGQNFNSQFYLSFVASM